MQVVADPIYPPVDPTTPEDNKLREVEVIGRCHIVRLSRPYLRIVPLFYSENK